MKIKSILASTAIVAVLPMASSAATIIWQFETIVNTGASKANMGTGYLATDGTLLLAENSGGAATTFDTISFAAGSYSLGGTSGNAFHASDPILDSGTYGTNGNGTNATGVDVSIGDDANASTANDIGVTLISGQKYRIQIIAADGRGNATTRSIEFGGNAADHATGVSGSHWGDSLLATGTFTADATYQVFNSQLFQDGSARNDTQFNAIIIHQVPEPSSVALLGLGGLALILRRRKG